MMRPVQIIAVPFVSFVLLALASSPASAQQPACEPGVLVKLYDIQQDMRFVPDLLPGQAPNVAKVLPTIDLRSERGDFQPLENQFTADVTGFIKIETPGAYTFRLISDDGAQLHLDGQLVLDHDGLHGPDPKDATVTLTAGLHALRVRQFQGFGGAQLTLEWSPPGAGDAFVLVPADVLSHTAGASLATAPGPKRIIPPLRRGRPGDGTPVAGVHPYYELVWAEAAGTPKTLAGYRYESLQILANPGDTATGSYIWLPPDPVPAKSIALIPVSAPTSESGHLYVAAYGRSGVQHLFVEPADGVYQGCVTRMTQGLAGSVQAFALSPLERLQVYVPDATGPDVPSHKQQLLNPTANRIFEIMAVRAMTNGLEVEFSQALDSRIGWDPESYYVEQWPFDAAQGVPPHRDGSTVPVKSATVSSTRKRVFLEIDGLKPSHMVYLRMLPPCVSEAGQQLWSTEAWYTLNRIPSQHLGEVKPPPLPAPQNILTPEEQQAGWRLLFDGQTTHGWHGFRAGEMPAGWQAVDGCLVRVGPGGDIVTDEQFDNFELQLEWRISPGGNSGIFFHVSEAYDAVWFTGPEMQVLDNAEHADGKNPKTSAASNYALHAPLRNMTEPVGMFNKARIVVHGNDVEHWLNGVKVVSYTLNSPEWKNLVAASKFADLPHYGREKTGHIALQDHGDKVWYRNIKIRTLPTGGMVGPGIR